MTNPRCLLIVLAILCAVASAQRRELIYTLDARPAVEDRGVVHVSIRYEGVPDDPVAFSIPAWKPGHYEIEEWQSRISRVVAESGGGRQLAVNYDGDRTWVVDSDRDEIVVIEYDVACPDAKSSWLACEGPETFMYVRNATANVPCTLKVELPAKWKVECALAREKGDPPIFRAIDYDELVDSPLEIGELTTDSFEVDGRTYVLVYNVEPRFDRNAMVEMTRSIVSHQTKMMGIVPYERYYFMWHLHDVGPTSFTGGLEHRASTTLYLPQSYFQRAVVDQTAALVAHEFFHLWNVKRILAATLGPFDYSTKVPVRSLWLLEGVTDYYADMTCVRTDIWNESRWLRQMRGEIQSLYSNPSYLAESVEEASLAAFDRGYGEAGLDYYNAGKLIGLCLDLEIRSATDNKKSLDDVMRLLYERFALPKPGYKDSDIRSVVSEVAGRDMRDWFRDYVEGQKDLPFAVLLPKLGIEFTRTENRVRVSSSTIGALYPTVTVEETGDGDKKEWVVVSVGSRAGVDLSPGDVIESFDGRAPLAPGGNRTFIGRNMASSLRKNSTSTEVTMRVRGKEASRSVKLPVPERIEYRIETMDWRKDGISEKAAALRTAFFEKSATSKPTR